MIKKIKIFDYLYEGNIVNIGLTTKELASPEDRVKK